MRNDRLTQRFRRWRKPVALLLLTLLALDVVASHVIKKRVRQMLGPDSRLESLHIGWTGAIVAGGLRFGAPEGWPAAETLTVERAVIRPDWTSFLDGEYRIRSVRIKGAYLAVQRSRTQGIRVLPTLLGREPRDPARPGWEGTLRIVSAQVADSTLEFFDESIAQQTLKLRVENLQAHIEDLLVPALDTRTQVELSGVVKGPQHDGDLALKGWIELRSRDSMLEIGLQGLDLLAVQPYLLRDSELGVQRGQMDLQLHSTVQGRKLDAPGTVKLSQLDFDRGSGLKGTFMGAPRGALLSVMEAGRGEIQLDFRLQGDLDSPQFSLREALPLRLAVGMAEVLGVSIKGVVGGVGTLGGKGLEAVGDAAKGIGSLFGLGGDAEDAQKPADKTGKAP